MPKINRKQILALAAFTLFGFGGIGLILIDYFVDRSFMDMLQGNYPIYFQFLIGAVFGTAAAITGWNIIQMPFMEKVRKLYTGMVGSIELKTLDILIISVCAGVGEEILFRGGIQPTLGIWLTSILFVALHGYLNPLNWRVSVYGAFMTLVIAGIGKLYVNVGAVSSFTAHTMIDIILLFAMSKEHQKEKESEKNTFPWEEKENGDENRSI